MTHPGQRPPQPEPAFQPGIAPFPDAERAYHARQRGPGWNSQVKTDGFSAVDGRTRPRTADDVARANAVVDQPDDNLVQTKPLPRSEAVLAVPDVRSTSTNADMHMQRLPEYYAAAGISIGVSGERQADVDSTASYALVDPASGAARVGVFEGYGREAHQVVSAARRAVHRQARETMSAGLNLQSDLGVLGSETTNASFDPASGTSALVADLKPAANGRGWEVEALSVGESQMFTVTPDRGKLWHVDTKTPGRFHPGMRPKPGDAKLQRRSVQRGDVVVLASKDIHPGIVREVAMNPTLTPKQKSDEIVRLSQVGPDAQVVVVELTALPEVQPVVAPAAATREAPAWAAPEQSSWLTVADTRSLGGLAAGEQTAAAVPPLTGEEITALPAMDAAAREAAGAVDLGPGYSFPVSRFNGGREMWVTEKVARDPRTGVAIVVVTNPRDRAQVKTFDVQRAMAMKKAYNEQWRG